MNHPDPIDVLNRLLRIVYRSLPVYLAEAKPWILRDGEQAGLLERIAQDRVDLAGRIAQAIVRLGGAIDSGSFPMEFTSTHDLSMDYLLSRVVEHLERDIAAIQQCVDDLRQTPLFCPLAEEALGNTRGHLENLKEMMTAKG